MTKACRHPPLFFVVVALSAIATALQIFGMIGLSFFQTESILHVLVAGNVLTEKGSNTTDMAPITYRYSNGARKQQDGKVSVTMRTHQEKKETQYDLIFWSKTPILRKDLTSSSFIVSRAFSTESNPFLSRMDEVVRVDFRLCMTICPSTTTRKIQSLLQYKKNKDRILKIYSTIEKHPLNDDLIQLEKLEVITFWSEELQQHIPLPISQDYRDIIHWASCQIHISGDCPRKCPQNHYHLEYPYHFDAEDKLCKSSHPDAIPPRRRYGGKCNCESTCFTPEAGEYNSTWPWKNETEQDRFFPHWNDSAGIQNTPRFYKQIKSHRLESSPYLRYQLRFPCTVDNTPTPRPIFDDYHHHLFFIPEAKMIFCGIPKVGVTEWIKFFRHVIGANDYLSLPHFKEDRALFLMKSLEFARAEELLNDASWTKAVFLRDPLERLLSAYMDKIVGGGYTQRVFQIGNLSDTKNTEQVVLNFTDFVNKISDKTNVDNCKDPNGLTACTDPHWKPQLMTCGLDYLLPKFDFIGNFNHISKHTKMLLDRVGLWDKYGATFDDGKDLPPATRNTCAVPPPQRPHNQTIWGFNQRGPSGTGNVLHATGSKSRILEYYTPELIKKVREAYAFDFAVWDEIMARPEEDVATGKELMVVKEYCASKAERN